MEIHSNIGTEHLNSTIEKYFHVESIFGRGGFGIVYAGVRKSDGLKFAIKEVPVTKVTEWSVLGGSIVPLEWLLLYSCQSIDGVVNVEILLFTSWSVLLTALICLTSSHKEELLRKTWPGTSSSRLLIQSYRAKRG